MEESRRFQIFRAALDEIERHNALYEQGKVTYYKGVTQFTDWTKEEFLEYVSQVPPTSMATPSLGTFMGTPNFTAPGAVDWRQKGLVGGVKNQGQCGSCWSFSSTGALEGQYAKHNGKMVLFSEQNLVDCCTPPQYQSRGCNGGFMTEAFRYIQANGITTEGAYPYNARQGTCRRGGNVVRIRGYREVAANERVLEEAVATVGPIAVGIDATGALQNYRGGIFSDNSCNQQINHAVLAVGYGVENGWQFWIVKNSWGSGWGERGYFRLLKGRSMCGIQNMSSYPEL